MAKKKGSRSCSIISGMLGGGVLLGFLIWFGLPLFSAKPKFPDTPGIDPAMDRLWSDCSTNGTAWTKKCDALITNNPELTEYREFGLTCGGRHENIWGVNNCSDLDLIVENAPPGGVPVLAWQNKTIRTLCLKVNETYDWTDDEITLLEEETHWQLFDRYYLAVVEDGCDAVLTVDVVGTPLSAHYFPAGDRYTGADVRGRLSLTASGFQKLTSSFHGRIEPPDKYAEYEHQNKYTTPQEAPYREAAGEEILAILTEWFGPAVDG
jgi:hypothetical protein